MHKHAQIHHKLISFFFRKALHNYLQNQIQFIQQHKLQDVFYGIKITVYTNIYKTLSQIIKNQIQWQIIQPKKNKKKIIILIF